MSVTLDYRASYSLDFAATRRERGRAWLLPIPMHLISSCPAAGRPHRPATAASRERNSVKLTRPVSCKSRARDQRRSFSVGEIPPCAHPIGGCSREREGEGGDAPFTNADCSSVTLIAPERSVSTDENHCHSWGSAPAGGPTDGGGLPYGGCECP